VIAVDVKQVDIFFPVFFFFWLIDGDKNHFHLLLFEQRIEGAIVMMKLALAWPAPGGPNVDQYIFADKLFREFRQRQISCFLFKKFNTIVFA
jgi:hypothetical protein